MEMDDPDEDNSSAGGSDPHLDPRQANESTVLEYENFSHNEWVEESLGSSPPDRSGRAQQVSDRKWQILKEHYIDGYADLLRQNAVEAYKDGIPPIDLGSTQVGAVTWDPLEKVALYQALSLKGRHDVPSIAQKIGTKSELEVRGYLLLLHEKEADRHLFASQTKRISHAEIPAATEVSKECEERLEWAADAQAAYEEYYECIAKVQNRSDLWIIDRGAAQSLDEEADKLEEAILSTGGQTTDSKFTTSIFYVSKLVELSERIFMNQGHLAAHGTWHNLAIDDETPAFTQEVVAELYDLVVNFTRRLMQTSLFLAQSRQRATSSTYYRHKPMVRDVDVAAAIDVLKVNGDLWEYWIGVARRNKLDVIRDTGTKDGAYRSKNLLSYEEIEQNLSKRKKKWRGRRRRSSATTSDVSATENETEGEDPALPPFFSDVEGSMDTDSASPRPHLSSTSADDGDEEMTRKSEPNSSDSESTSSRSFSSSESFSFSFHGFTPHQKRRHIDLELQQDTYLSEIDAEHSRREETRLWRILGHTPPVSLKAEDEEEERPVRPIVLRKTNEDLKDPFEFLEYRAEWERFGGVVPAESFAEVERASKRRKVASRRPSKKYVHQGGTLIRQPLPIRSYDRAAAKGNSDTDSDPDFEPNPDFEL